MVLTLDDVRGILIPLESRAMDTIAAIRNADEPSNAREWRKVSDFEVYPISRHHVIGTVPRQGLETYRR
jgi:hypothetical protein